MVKSVEDLAVKSVDEGLVGRLLLLFSEQGDHLVPDRLRVVIHNNGLRLLLQLVELFLLLVLLGLLLVLEQRSWVDERGTLLGTFGVAGEAEVGGDVVDDRAAT